MRIGDIITEKNLWNEFTELCVSHAFNSDSQEDFENKITELINR